jgi:hypothetical protein
MKRNVFAMILLCLMAGCAIENRDPSDHAEGFDISRRESAKDAQLSTTASLTWQLDSIENCFDSFLGPCTATQPGLQCPSVREGQSCSVELAECTKVIGNRWDTFFCL